MNPDEVSCTDATSMDDVCTTKFLELLLRYDYQFLPNDQEAFNLQDEAQTQFMKDCQEFLPNFDETQASKEIIRIRELYFKELAGFYDSAKESELSWFPLAHKIFSRAQTSERGASSTSQPLDLTKSLSKPSDSESRALKDISDASKDTQVVLVKMDIRKQNEVEDARKFIDEKVGDKGLNLLINNAGVAKMQGFPDITDENMLLHFSTNTLGPVCVLKEMLPLLQKAAALQSQGMNVSRAAVLNISAMGGSITEVSDAQPRIFLSAMGYRISKAALNMAMRLISFTIKDQGILVVNMCPGWTKTDMGSERAMLTVEESVSDMMKTLPQLNEEHHGIFMNRKGVIAQF